MMTSGLRHGHSSLQFASEARKQLAAGAARQAVETCKRGLARYPSHAAGYVVLSAAYRALGEESRARLVLERGFARTGMVSLRPAATGSSAVAGDNADAASGSQVDGSDLNVTAADEWIEARAGGSVASDLHDTTPSEASRDTVDVEPLAAVDKPSSTFADEFADETDESVARTAQASITDASRGSVIDASPERRGTVQAAITDSSQASVAHVSQGSADTTRTSIDDVSHESIADASQASIEDAARASIADASQASIDGASQASIADASNTNTTYDVVSIEGRQPASTLPQASADDAASTEDAFEDDDSVDQAPVHVAFADSTFAHEQRASELTEGSSEHVVATVGAKTSVDLPHLREPASEPPLSIQVSTPEANESPRPVEPPHQREPATLAATSESTERVALFQRFGVRSDERSSPALALHSGKSAHRLTSANLRLIPGLEFTPLRAEENSRRLAIAAIMEDPLPDWEPRRRSFADDGPPLPEYPSTDELSGDPWSTLERMLPDADEQIRVALAGSIGGLPHSAGREVPEVIAAHDADQPPEPRGIDVLHMINERASPVDEEPSAIDRLARRLEGARIAPVGDATSNPRLVFEPSIVSDTLAEILVSQRAFGEAIKAFMTLARSRPEKLVYYEARIAEMKMRIRDDEGSV